MCMGRHKPWNSLNNFEKKKKKNGRGGINLSDIKSYYIATNQSYCIGRGRDT